jgi:hypothetical protein
MSSEFIHSIFSNLRRAQNIENTNTILNQLQTQAAISKVSKAGVNPGDNFNGFSSLTGINDVVSNVAGSTPTQVTTNLVLTELTSVNNSELSSTLVKEVGSQSDLTTITGSNDLTTGSLLDDVVSSGSPEAMAQALTTAVGATSDQIKAIVGRNIDLSSPLSSTGSLNPMDDYEIYAQNFLTSSFNNIFSVTNSLSALKSNAVSEFLSSAGKVIAKNTAGYNSIMDNIVEDNLKITENAVLQLTSPEFSRSFENNKVKIISLIANKNYIKAVDLISSMSNKTADEIYKALIIIDVSASKNLVENIPVSSVPGIDLSKLKNEWKGRDTPNSYFKNNMFSEREILNEVSNIDRDITEVIIISTNTTTDVLANAYSLHQKAIDAGRNGIGYHYVFTRSGDLQRGLPADNETPPNRLLVNDHHKRSIVIGLVGGIDREAGRGINYRDYYSSNSYTDQQMKTLKKFLKSLYLVKPGVQVFGISQINVNQPGPHFDVDSFIKNSFKRQNNLDYDPSVNPPLERKDII